MRSSTGTARISASGRPPRVCFINTFKPVVPLYDEVFPRLKDQGVNPVALLSRGTYRLTERRAAGERATGAPERYVWVPRLLARNKRWCALSYAIFAPWKIFREDFDLCVVLSQPPLFFAAAALACRATRRPYVLHVMDLYPQVLAKTGHLRAAGPVYRLLSGLAVRALRDATAVVAIGRCMRDRLVAMGVPGERIEVVPNWASRAIVPISPAENLFRREHGFERDFLVMYSGNMGKAHVLRTLLGVAKRLEGTAHLHFVFIGSGSRRREVEEAIAAGARNVVLLGYQPEERLSHSLSAADLHFLSLAEGFEGLMVPSKFYGMLASGRPVLYEGNDAGEVAQAVKEIGCGRVVPLGDEVGLAQAIMDSCAAPKDRAESGRRAREAYETLYSPDVGAQKYVALIERILSRHAPERDPWQTEQPQHRPARRRTS